MQTNDTKKLFEKAMIAWRNEDQRAANILIDRVLQQDFLFQEAWEFLHLRFGKGETLEEFRFSFTSKNYPKNIHLLEKKNTLSGLQSDEGNSSQDQPNFKSLNINPKTKPETFCSECNHKLVGKSRFCTYCGAGIENVPVGEKAIAPSLPKNNLSTRVDDEIVHPSIDLKGENRSERHKRLREKSKPLPRKTSLPPQKKVSIFRRVVNLGYFSLFIVGIVMVISGFFFVAVVTDLFFFDVGSQIIVLPGSLFVESLGFLIIGIGIILPLPWLYNGFMGGVELTIKKMRGTNWWIWTFLFGLIPVAVWLVYLAFMSLWGTKARETAANALPAKKRCLECRGWNDYQAIRCTHCGQPMD